MNTEINLEVKAKNESGIEDKFNKPFKNQMEIDRPLSPILNSSGKRKIFSSKCQRSRIKLNKLFDTDKTKAIKEEVILTESSFNLGTTEDEDLISCLNKLEEIELNREVAYKTLVVCENSDLCFKKPISPAPKTPKRLKKLISQEINTTVSPVDIKIATPNFQTATGKNIEIDIETINKHSKIFEDILSSSQNQTSRKNKHNFLRKTQSDHTFSCETSLSDTQIVCAAEQALNSLTSEFEGFSNEDLYNSEVIRDKFRSNDTIKINKVDLPTEIESVEMFKQTMKKRVSVKQKLNFFDDLLDSNTDSIETQPNKKIKMDICGFGQFSKASGKEIVLKTDYLNKAKDIFKDIDLNTDLQCNNVPSTNVVTPESKKSNGVKEKLKYFDTIIGDSEDFIPKSNLNIPKIAKLNFFDNSLGKFTSASGISLKPSMCGLKKAGGLFDDILNEKTDFTTPIKSTNDSGVRKNKRKLGVSCLRQIPMEANKLQKASLLFDEDLTGISPIKPLNQKSNNYSHSTPISARKTFHESDKSICDRNEKSVFNLNEKSIIDRLPDDCLVTFDVESKNVTDYDEEVKRLEMRLNIVKNRKDMMELMNKEKPDCDKKPMEGVLYKAKNEVKRISLKVYVNGETPGNQIDNRLTCITPQNAVNIHFKEFTATVRTKDGATVVPNIKDLIGVSEIGFAFKAMPGVDPRLISKNWIENHYKWIVWKLASYERTFPDYFKGSLAVEHVMQQLKYRYDREIDKAERSAVRKILEKDDVSQKRMILCVSAIKRIEFNVFELELTDGWYGVRTVIDERLCYQISKGKIKVGTKLVICGAELMNCDGCHPLEVTDLTYLKINCNSTRRARWDTRLGYQIYPGPFSIPIRSVHHAGGTIGRIDVCVARCYPFRYLDKSAAKSVWRNEKAEERRARNWENEKYKQLERLEDEYETNSCLDTRREFDAKIKEDADKLKCSRNETHPVMKLLVVDLNGSPTEAFSVFVWKPTEDHLHSLKENTCTAIFHVYPKANGDLHTGNKTIFESKPNVNNHMSPIFDRKLIRISDLNDSKFSVNFKEFDTVGVVVRVRVDKYDQEIWLGDNTGRLALVRIFEGPETCLLLDNLKRGQVISVCNLVYRGVQDKFELCKAMANHFSIFSLYPKYKHLQNGLEDFKKDLPKDLEGLLKICDSKIELFKSKEFSNVSNDSDEDSTLISSRITSTDIALSLIDFDKFI